MAVAVLWFLLWVPPLSWSQEDRSNRQEQQASAPSPEISESPEEVPPAIEELLAPLEEAPVPSPETQTVPLPEEGTRPRTYTVKEGDTLWGISNAFLKNPLLWPTVFENNPYIVNPDLIYPGSMIVLPGGEEAQPSVFIEAAQPIPSILPPVAEEPVFLEMEIEKDIEVAAPEKTLAGAKPVETALLASTGYILTGGQAMGTIMGAQDNRELLGQGEGAYLLPKKGSPLSVGDRYTLYRVVRKIYHPKTRKYVGDLIRILGVAEVAGANTVGKVPAQVLISYDYIQKGDFFMAVQPQEMPTEPISPFALSDQGVTGFIIEAKEDRRLQSWFDVVYLDRGHRDGVQVGDRFAIVREGEKISFFPLGRGTYLPRRVIGRLQILSVQDATATARIIQSTEVIYKGDRFETPSSP